MLQFPRPRVSPLHRKNSDGRFSKLLRDLLAMGLVALLILAPLSFSVSAHTLNSISGTTSDGGGAGSTLGGTKIHGFIIETGANGQTYCREATPAEVPQLMAPADAPRERIKVVSYNKSNSLQNQTVDGGDNIGSGGLEINFNVLSQLQNDPNKAQVLASFTKAAQYWTDRIKTHVSIDIDIDYGTNRPGGSAFPSGVLGSTGSASIGIDYQGFRHNLIAAAGSNSARSTLYNSLPTAFLPTDVGNGAVIDINYSTAKALGIPVPSGSLATISFNKNFAFDFDQSDGISGNRRDFTAVATHEIGHALGFTSGGGEGSTATPTPWDLYRFRPSTAAGNFTNAQRTLALGGGSQVFFTGQTFAVQFFPATTELALSTGGPSGSTTSGGDGNQSSHWKDDDQAGGAYIGIMDPTLGTNIVRLPTENDYIALEAMGWDLTGNGVIPGPPPPPSPPGNDNFASAQALVGCSGTATGTNVGATKESGEPNNPDSPGSLRSVWFTWQSPGTGSVTIDTAGSGFDTVLAVYTGNSVNGLTLIANNDDAVSGSDVTSTVTFNATAGTTYRIAINGFNNQGSLGDIGSFKLNWSAANCTAAPTLLTEANSSRVIALDSVTFVAGPFHKTGSFNFSGDQTTRVMLFTSNLGTTDPSAVTVQAGGVSLPVEVVGTVRELDQASFIIVKLPSTLPVGDLNLTVSLHGVPSNTATISIAN